MSASWILHINAFHTCPIEAWETAGFHSSQTLQQLAPLINTNATKAEELNGEMSYSSILGEAKYWESSALEPNGRKKAILVITMSFIVALSGEGAIIHNHRFINHVSILVSLEWVSVYSWACRYNTYPSMLKECWSLINDSITDTPDHRISVLHSNLSTIMGRTKKLSKDVRDKTVRPWTFQQ